MIADASNEGRARSQAGSGPVEGRLSFGAIMQPCFFPSASPSTLSKKRYSLLVFLFQPRQVVYSRALQTERITMSSIVDLETPPKCTADFCLIPLGTPTASVSLQIADVQRLLKQSGLKYSMHSAGTTVGKLSILTRRCPKTYRVLPPVATG